MHRTALASFTLSAFALTGCYASHEAIDEARCAPAGTHTVMTEIVSSSGGCGIGDPGGPLEVRIPPSAEELFPGTDTHEVVMVGPCRWEVHAASAAVDFSTRIDGFIDTSDGTVRGAFDLEVSGFAGDCTATLAWTEPD